MDNRLETILTAHGGLERFRLFQSVSVDLIVGGALWALKKQDGVLADTTVTVGLGEEWASHFPVGEGRDRSHFSPAAVSIENADGVVTGELKNPRASFEGHGLETPWTVPQLAYFAGYAMWTYLNLPFLASSADVSVHALPDWKEGGETWHRLALTFDDRVATHSKVQTIYFGTDGLLRRHDYSVEIAGDAPAAHYIEDYVWVDGLAFPTHRRVYVVNPDNTPNSDLMTVSIDLSNFRLEPL